MPIYSKKMLLCFEYDLCCAMEIWKLLQAYAYSILKLVLSKRIYCPVQVRFLKE